MFETQYFIGFLVNGSNPALKAILLRTRPQLHIRRARQGCSCPFINIRFDRLLNGEVLLVQAPARLGSRQALSKGRRQAWGAMSWWIDFGPHEPGW